MNEIDYKKLAKSMRDYATIPSNSPTANRMFLAWADVVEKFDSALTEARQQVAKQKDEEIRRLQKEVDELRKGWGDSCRWSEMEKNAYRSYWEDKSKALESTNAELEKEKLNLLTCAANQAEEISKLTRRVKELDKREHIAGCYEVYGDCTCSDLHKEVTEELKQESLRHLKYLSDANAEISRLKAENESLRQNLLSNPWPSDIEKRDKEIASLTSRLSEALGVLKGCGCDCDVDHRSFDEIEKHDKQCALYKAKSVLTHPDNARLLERDRIKNSFIHLMRILVQTHDTDNNLAAYEVKSHLESMDKDLEALEAHEKEGGV